MDQGRTEKAEVKNHKNVAPTTTNDFLNTSLKYSRFYLQLNLKIQ